MDEDLRQLGEDLITTAARTVRWVPNPDSFGLTLAAARILARLSDNGPTRISDLAEQELSSQPTITNHVKRLEATGLVGRSADLQDARAWRISLTPEGTRQLAEMRNLLGTRVQPYLAKMSRRDLKALREGVDAMHRLMALDRLPR
jgi:DNA-binding MarR family transcriptional regulator